MFGTLNGFSTVVENFGNSALEAILNVLLSILYEFFKFILVLLLIYAVAYAIFSLWSRLLDGNNRKDSQMAANVSKDRLSQNILGEDSFSKYPFILDIPSKSFADLLKTPKKTDFAWKRSLNI